MVTRSCVYFFLRGGGGQNQHSSLQYILKCIAVATYTVWYGSVLFRCLHFLTALFEIVLCMKMFNSSDCQKDITLLHLCVLYNNNNNNNNNVKLRFYIPEFWIFVVLHTLYGPSPLPIHSFQIYVILGGPHTNLKSGFCCKKLHMN